jgi:para-nitrobenzyl esterase
MDLTVKTKYGMVEGFEADGIRRWFGIPFAKPPVGELRFKRTRECEPWDGVRQTREFGPRPFQFMDVKAARKLPWSEDCLYLNVWAPGDAERCPVFVYYYGGANVSGDGSDPMYDGSAFARDGVVYVTFNYRLGPLGFYDFSPWNRKFESNCGVADQIMGLRWVRENIRGFGGDPDNITICGESAGGTAVYDMLAAPSARGLFRRAIAMSGLADDTVHPRQNRLNMELFLGKMGMEPKDVPRLLTMEPPAMLKAADWVYRKNNTVYPYIFVPGPVIDDLLPKKPWEAMADGDAKGIDCVFGTCRDEGTLFSLLRMFPTTWEGPECMAELNGCVDKLPALRSLYAGMGTKKALQAFSRDRAFWVHSVKCADAQSRHARVYAYRNDIVFPLLKLTGLGAMHGSDIGTALDTATGAMNMVSAGISRKRKRTLRGYVHGAWVNFARTGDPNGTIPVRWEPYDERRRPTMILNDTCAMAMNPRGEAFEVWKDIELYR